MLLKRLAVLRTWDLCLTYLLPPRPCKNRGQCDLLCGPREHDENDNDITNQSHFQGDCDDPPELPSPQHQWSLHQMYKGRHQTDSISPLSVSDQRKYKKGNKHKGDYCFVDLGLESGSSGEQKKRSSSFSHSNRSWKTLTFNKK